MSVYNNCSSQGKREQHKLHRMTYALMIQAMKLHWMTHAFIDSGNEASLDDACFYDSGNGENTS